MHQKRYRITWHLQHNNNLKIVNNRFQTRKPSVTIVLLKMLILKNPRKKRAMTLSISKPQLQQRKALIEEKYTVAQAAYLREILIVKNTDEFHI